jgi:hypothetical protein
MKRALLITAGLALATPGAQAQEVSDGVKRACRSTAESTARTIAYAKRAKLDPASQVRKVADSWLEGVQTHMLLAASRAEHLSESELAALGYSYCVERRPTNVR